MEMVTWEDEYEINCQLPGVDASAYGEAVKSGGGDVTTEAFQAGGTSSAKASEEAQHLGERAGLGDEVFNYFLH